MKKIVAGGAGAALLVFTVLAAAPSAQVWTVDGPGSSIGVQVIPDSPEASQPDGAVIGDVSENSPAARAGFRQGDVVVEFDGERVRSARQFRRLVQETRPNRAVDAVVVRNGARQRLSVTPELSRADAAQAVAGRLRMAPTFSFDTQGLLSGFWYGPGAGRLGADVMTLDDQLAGYFGVQSGVLVTSVNADTPAARAGLRAGDVITSVAGQRITAPSDVTGALGRVQAGASLDVEIVREKKASRLTVALPAAAPRRIVAPRAAI